MQKNQNSFPLDPKILRLYTTDSVVNLLNCQNLGVMSTSVDGHLEMQMAVKELATAVSRGLGILISKFHASVGMA